MKTILTILMLTVTALCFGQKKIDTDINNLKVITNENFGKLDSITKARIIAFADVHYNLPKPYFDTVECIMLVANPNQTFIDKYEIESLANQWEITYTLIGYAVRKHTISLVNGNTSNLAYYQAEKYDSIELITYLDRNKKPLDKNIIVWMSKTLTK